MAESSLVAVQVVQGRTAASKLRRCPGPHPAGQETNGCQTGADFWCVCNLFALAFTMFMG